MKICYKGSFNKMESTTESYKKALKTLNNLQSNVDSLHNWIGMRKINPNFDLKPEMTNYLSRLELNTMKLPFIHVAGTKGKGSTCAFSESILRNCGLKTGLFTSPHLVSVRERIKINGIPISQELFSNYFWECWNKLEQTKTTQFPNMPAYFRFLTLMAFKIFIAEKVDVTVMEVGIGGRTDATNVEGSVVCGITSLGYDHQEVLGNTLTEIAYEKSGIFKVIKS